MGASDPAWAPVPCSSRQQLKPFLLACSEAEIVSRFQALQMHPRVLRGQYGWTFWEQSQSRAGRCRELASWPLAWLGMCHDEKHCRMHPRLERAVLVWLGLILHLLGAQSSLSRLSSRSSMLAPHGAVDVSGGSSSTERNVTTVPAEPCLGQELPRWHVVELAALWMRDCGSTHGAYNHAYGEACQSLCGLKGHQMKETSGDGGLPLYTIVQRLAAH